MIDEFRTTPPKDKSGFIQVSRKYLSQQRELAKKNHLSWQILSFMTEKMNKGNAIMLSAKALEELTGYKRASISKAMSILKDEKWIQIVKVGTANAYFINAKAYWTTATNKKQYAKFTAEIITSASEQKKTVDELNNETLKEVPNIRDETILINPDEKLLPPDQSDIDF